MQQHFLEKYDVITSTSALPWRHGAVIKDIEKRLEFHCYQVCNDIINFIKTRRKKVQAKEFVFLNLLQNL